MLKTVLVALDGSRRSEGVLGPVTRLVRFTKGKLVLFHAVTPSEYFSLTAAKYVQQARERSKAYLRELSARLEKDGIQVVQRIVTGEASRGILEEARRSRADLIVLSTHGRSGVHDWPFGSVAERVLRTTTLPVLVFRSLFRNPADLRKMMIALDGSEEALRIIPSASDISAALGAPVVLVHVGRHVPLMVQLAVRALNRQRIPFKLRLLHGDPASTILAAAEEEKADVLAVATRSRGDRRSLSELSEGLLKNFGSSVLAVHGGRVG